MRLGRPLFKNAGKVRAVAPIPEMGNKYHVYGPANTDNSDIVAVDFSLTSSAVLAVLHEYK